MLQLEAMDSLRVSLALGRIPLRREIIAEAENVLSGGDQRIAFSESLPVYAGYSAELRKIVRVILQVQDSSGLGSLAGKETSASASLFPTPMVRMLLQPANLRWKCAILGGTGTPPRELYCYVVAPRDGGLLIGEDVRSFATLFAKDSIRTLALAAPWQPTFEYKFSQWLLVRGRRSGLMTFSYAPYNNERLASEVVVRFSYYSLDAAFQH